MLQSRSIVHSCGNSGWLILRLFVIYNSGQGLRGRVSFITCGSVRKRRFRNPNSKRHQIMHKAHNCLLLSRKESVHPDGQFTSCRLNKAAAFTQRIRRSRLRIRGAVMLGARRAKYLKLASNIV